jgi:predicted Fe-Mo cluster-binding NifX family protein
VIETKLAVSATGESLDAQVDPRFGRCAYFVIVDSETLAFEAIPNTAASAMGGAGIQAAQMVVEKDVKVVITGNVGPNAFQALSAARIGIVAGAVGTVREAVSKYNDGELKEISAPSVRGHFGTSRGRGQGRR